MHRITVLLALSILVYAVPNVSHAQEPGEKKLVFELTGDSTLNPISRSPVLKVGDILRVEINDLFDKKPTWSFMLEADSLTAEDPDSTASPPRPLSFKSDSIAVGTDGPVALRFADSDSVVTLAVPITLDIDTEEAAEQEITQRPNTTGTAASPLNVPRCPTPTYSRQRDEVNLCFDTTGLLVRGTQFPRDVDDNDVINIYLIAPLADAAQIFVTVDGTVASGEPAIMGIGALANLQTLGDIRGTEEGVEPPQDQLIPMGSYGPYASPSITIRITRQEEGEQPNTVRSHVMRIEKTYSVALRYGVGRSGLRFNNYAVRPFADDSTRIKNVADSDGEPRQFLSVVFYSWKIPGTNIGSWKAKDNTERTASFASRISPFVGLGLQDLGDEFMVGVSVEVARGLDFVWGLQLARRDRLNGDFEEGDVFMGTDAELPVEDDWKVSPNYLGFSVDLRIAAQVLTGLLGGG